MLFPTAHILLPIFMLKAMLTLDSQPASVKREIIYVNMPVLFLSRVLLLQFDMKATRHWMNDKIWKCH